MLGKDWNHNYEVHLEFTDGEAVLLREDGKEERFFWEKDRYLSLFASEGALEKGENGYTYRTRDQKTYRFDKEGKCLETESLTGSRITFAYEEEAPFRLVKVQKRKPGNSLPFSMTQRACWSVYKTIREDAWHTGIRENF